MARNVDTILKQFKKTIAQLHDRASEMENVQSNAMTTIQKAEAEIEAAKAEKERAAKAIMGLEALFQ